MTACSKGVKSMTIADLKNGDPFKVKRVVLGKEIGKRLADMGFVRGVEGRVIRSAFLGDPLQVKICHYDISLRRKEARGVEVEPVAFPHCKDGTAKESDTQ